VKAVIYFDKPYTRWAHIYLESLRLFEPDIKVVIYLYNTKKQIMYQLYEHPNVLDVHMRKMKYMSEKAVMWKHQIVGQKGNIMLDVMKRYPDEKMFMLTDVDLLLRRSLLSLKLRMIYRDMAFVMSKSKTGKPKAMGGLIVFKNKKKMVKLAQDYDKALTTGRAYKSRDQLTLAGLSEIYSRGKYGIKLLYLEYHKYLDPFNTKKSIIWSPHKSLLGSKDKRFRIFKRELERLKNVDTK
jgi:hypothetical protein